MTSFINNGSISIFVKVLILACKIVVVPIIKSDEVTNVMPGATEITTDVVAPSAALLPPSILRPVLDIVLLAAPLLDDTLHYIGHSRVAPFQIGISCGTPTSSLGDKIGHLDYFLEGGIVFYFLQHK